jgi:malate permease and related proteins
VVNALLAGLWGALRSSDPATRATNVLSGCVVNHGNMGLPIAALAFGADGLRLAVVVFVAGVVVWSSFGIALAAWVRGHGSGREALARPLRYPALYAAAAGTAVNLGGVDLPALVSESASTLGQASIPCMLVVLGLQFRRPDMRDLIEPLAVGANRLLVGPLAGWGLAAVVGLEGLAANTAILQSGMPAAVMSTILARELDGRPELAVNTVLVTTLLSLPTLTVLVTMLR